ncbi:unnamed protein product [Cunninghamella blakesleeana]
MLNRSLLKVLLATLFIQQVLGVFWIVTIDKVPLVNENSPIENDTTYLTFNIFDSPEGQVFLKPKCGFSRKYDTTITSDQEDNYLTCGKGYPSIDVIGHDTTLTGLKVLDSKKTFPCILLTTDKEFDTYSCSESIPIKK